VTIPILGAQFKVSMILLN